MEKYSFIALNSIQLCLYLNLAHTVEMQRDNSSNCYSQPTSDKWCWENNLYTHILFIFPPSLVVSSLHFASLSRPHRLLLSLKYPKLPNTVLV